MKSTLSPSLILLVLLPRSVVHAFSITTTIGTPTSISSPPISTSTSSSSSSLQMCPGGWGIGTPLDFKDEEYSSSKSSRRGRRRRRKDSSSSSDGGGGEDTDEVAYNAETKEKIDQLFRMKDAQEFTQTVQTDMNNLQLQKKKDLMEIAKIAGLGDRMTPKANVGNERGLGGVGSGVKNVGGEFGEFDIDFENDDEDLDVRVQWDE